MTDRRLEFHDGWRLIFGAGRLQIIEFVKYVPLMLKAKLGVPMSESNFDTQAAVLLAITESPNGRAILLTRRAAHLNSHAGEVAFPGGMWESSDKDLCATALRESFEEVGLHPQSVAVEAQMAPQLTRSGVKVTPFVGRVDLCSLTLTVNPAELDALFWVPLQFFLDDLRLRTDSFVVEGKRYWAPAYQYDEFVIWGFTARVVVSYLNMFCGADIQCDPR